MPLYSQCRAGKAWLGQADSATGADQVSSSRTAGTDLVKARQDADLGQCLDQADRALAELAV